MVLFFILFLMASMRPSYGEIASFQRSLASRTPYDSKYRRVEDFLKSIQKPKDGVLGMSFSNQESVVRRYLDRAKGFRFQSERLLPSGIEEDHWQLPGETESLGTGDCEDLAIWLYYQLLEEGLSNVRLTLGLAGGERKTMHAWVSWYERGRIYILDPSRTEGIYPSTSSELISYDPKYSFYFAKRWLHQ
jgi:hypothetical protein